MPNAVTMLDHYQRQMAAARGAGLAGVTEQARLAGTIRALLEVVNDDHDPRRVVGAPKAALGLFPQLAPR